jgi:large subunit ribosomal protein L23
MKGTVLIQPVITEKSARMAQDNQYVFAVNQDATKIDVRGAVEKMFKVKVVAVRVVNVKGKLKSRGLGRAVRWIRRPDVKRAVVRLAKGQQIDPTALK